jgi:hypothetical protein
MSDDLGNILGTESPEPATPPTPHADVRWGRANKLSQRYSDGYLASDVLVRLGGIVKVIGYVLGGIAVVGGFIASIVSSSHDEAAGGIGIFLLTLLYGAIIVFGHFVIGSVVAAFGQLIRAMLDSAVNSAPFLTDDERASILSID